MTYQSIIDYSLPSGKRLSIGQEIKATDVSAADLKLLLEQGIVEEIEPEETEAPVKRARQARK